MSSMKKHFSQKINRLNQAFSQSIGRSEKSEVLSEDLQHVDNRVESMVDVLKHTKKKLVECLRSKAKTSSTKDDSIEKRKGAFEEYKLSQAMLNSAKEMDSSFGSCLLSDVMALYAETLGAVVQEMVKYEVNVEHHVVDRLTKFVEEMDNISQQKDKLKKMVLEMDATKSKLNAAQSRSEERLSEIQDEFDMAYAKVESSRDSFLVDLYTLAGKEVEMAGLYRTLIDAQMEYHRSALSRLESVAPTIRRKVDTYARRPVYGCPLEDHLRYTGRDIALVLEVCCTALLELGLRDEGLFRIPGNATKVRKLKAVLDAGETDIGDLDKDPHAIAGALKQYLRELPDPLMSGGMYDEWIHALSVEDPDQRLLTIRHVLSKLPLAHYNNLRYLIKFLSKLLENQAYTKMSSQNLAIVMAPNMLWNSLQADEFGLSSTHGAVVELLVANANFFFSADSPYTGSSGDAFSSNSDSWSSRQSALSVDVSFPRTKLAAEDTTSTDKQISPAKSGSRKPKLPAPPPPQPPVSSISPQQRSALDQSNSMRSSFHALESDRSPTAKLMDSRVPESIPPPRLSAIPAGTFGHRKSNSLDRPLRPPPLPHSESRKSAGHGMDNKQGGANAFGNNFSGDTSDWTKRQWTENEIGTQLGQNPPSASSKSGPVSQYLAGLSGVDELVSAGTTVKVLASDESDEEEAVVNETGYAPATHPIGHFSPNSILPSRPAPAPTSPKQVSYVTVLGEQDPIEQHFAQLDSLAACSVTQQQSPFGPSPAPRPKPPVPTKPRALESPEKDSIIRF